MFFGLIQRGDAAIDDDLKRRKVLLQAVDDIVTQGRNLAVFLWTQPVKPCLARMDDECLAPRICYSRDEIGQVFIAVAVVNADPRLYRDRN